MFPHEVTPILLHKEKAIIGIGSRLLAGSFPHAAAGGDVLLKTVVTLQASIDEAAAEDAVVRL